MFSLDMRNGHCVKGQVTSGFVRLLTPPSTLYWETERKTERERERERERGGGGQKEGEIEKSGRADRQSQDNQRDKENGRQRGRQSMKWGEGGGGEIKREREKRDIKREAERGMGTGKCKIRSCETIADDVSFVPRSAQQYTHSSLIPSCLQYLYSSLSRNPTVPRFLSSYKLFISS